MKFLFLLLTLYLFLSCNKSNCLKYFEFYFPATITEGDTFNIGDTLWIEMNLPNQVTNHQDRELVDLSGFDLMFSLSIEEMNTAYVNSAMTNFDLIEKIGSIESSLSTYIHFKSITEKELQLGIVPKKTGVYFLALSLPIAYGIAEETGEMRVDNSSCDYHDITKYSGVQFNEGKINYYLNELYPCAQSSPTDTLLLCYKDSAFTASGGGYAFVVE